MGYDNNDWSEGINSVSAIGISRRPVTVKNITNPQQHRPSRSYTFSASAHLQLFDEPPLSDHRPDPTGRSQSKLKAAAYKADASPQQIIELVR